MATITDKDIFCEVIHMTLTRRYASNGKEYTRHHGASGWKVTRTKNAKSTLDQFRAAVLKSHAIMERHNLLSIATQFKKLFGDDAWRAMETYKMLGDDVDGAWSEMNDCGCRGRSYTVEDIKEGAQLVWRYKENLKDARQEFQQAATA